MGIVEVVEVAAVGDVWTYVVDGTVTGGVVVAMLAMSVLPAIASAINCVVVPEALATSDGFGTTCVAVPFGGTGGAAGCGGGADALIPRAGVKSPGPALISVFHDEVRDPADRAKAKNE